MKTSKERSIIYIDLWMFDNRSKLAIELKYKTRKIQTKIHGESFNLKDQSAHDWGRYDFFRDIERLENIVCDNNITGYAILLTNDSSYWKEGKKLHPTDEMFRIHEGKMATGKLTGKIKGKEKPIRIKGSYKFSWQDYSEINGEKFGKFRYLLVEIKHFNRL
jgi:hypothetical protein